jgi:uncharacterized protein YfcZ (UPF0381/DUF406 family)
MVAARSNVVEQRVQPPAPGHSSLETMTHEYYDPSEGVYQHYACAKNGKVMLCNDSDGEYEQVFGSREELQRFVDHLMAVADEAWEEYCEASLDLSNQDEVGEAGAIAALDDLYANNNEGMRRLADG